MHRLLHVSYTKLHVDAVQVQHVQRHVLQMLQDEYPELMYPAALGCLADLHEVLVCIPLHVPLLLAVTASLSWALAFPCNDCIFACAGPLLAPTACLLGACACSSASLHASHEHVPLQLAMTASSALSLLCDTCSHYKQQ